MYQSLQHELFDNHPSLKNKYLIEDRLGSGSFGEIFSIYDVKNSQMLAMKLEKKSGKHLETLKREAKILQMFRKEKGFPSIHLFAQDSKSTIMIMGLLGYNLEKLFKLCNNKFSLKTVLMLADQMIQRIEVLHNRGFIHRDIKPENWVIGNLSINPHTLHLIDFGLTKSYRETSGYHIQFTSGKGLIGTARYCSINSHKGFELSRRDDLECVAYTLIYFLKGKLPWQDLLCNDKKKKYNMIKELKETAKPEVLCEGLPKEFANFLKLAKSYNFIEAPNYKLIMKGFRDLLLKQGYEYDYKYDWYEINEFNRALPKNCIRVRQIKETSCNFEQKDMEEGVKLIQKNISDLKNRIIKGQHLGEFIAANNIKKNSFNTRSTSPQFEKNFHDSLKLSKSTKSFYNYSKIGSTRKLLDITPFHFISSKNTLAVEGDNKFDGSSYINSSKLVSFFGHNSLLKCDSELSEKPKVFKHISPGFSEQKKNCMQPVVHCFDSKLTENIDNSKEGFNLKMPFRIEPININFSNNFEENLDAIQIDEFTKGESLEMQMDQIKSFQSVAKKKNFISNHC